MGMKDVKHLLEGGRPNSLGNTVFVVEMVLADRPLFEQLFNCYFCNDELVRLRVSNALKRLVEIDKNLILPYVGRLINEVALIEQPSVQWTLAQLFQRVQADMSTDQVESATELMKKNLSAHTDWIVLTTTMDTLVRWSAKDKSLALWLVPHLERLSKDSRRSVAGRAIKSLKRLSTGI